MSEFSPMMRRVRREKNWAGSRFPKKGRIRIVLILLIAGCIALVYFKGVPSFNIFERKVSNSKVKVVNVSEEDKKKRSKNREILNSSQRNILLENGKKSGYGITFQEIGGLLNERKRLFNHAVDTLVKDKHTLVLHYSIDTTLQKLANSLMQRYKPRYGAIVAMHPVTGRVVSLVSWEHDSVPSLGGALFSKSLFPAASIYKTITAAAAVEIAGFTSESTIHHTGRNHTLYKYQLEPDLKMYKDVSLEEAYANSINPVFARIGMYVLRNGALIEFGKRFGFDTDIPFEFPIEKSTVQPPDSNLTIAELASGFNQKTTLSPMLGALIASAISEKGKIPQPHCVDSITENGSTVYRAETEVWKTAISSKTADIVKGLMKGVSQYGTARKSFNTMKRSSCFAGIDYGGKTGSVDKDSAGRVDWFIGFARHPEDVRQRIAIGVVTVHGAYWTVHSSFIAAEMFRVYLREIQLADDKAKEAVAGK